jgi:hypothetical protein
VSILIVYCSGVEAKQYYVSPSGNDNSNDGSDGRPWASIGKAVGSSSPVGGGDIIIVRAGSYATGSIDFGKSGSDDSPITLKADGDVVLDCSGEFGFNLREKNNWIIDGFRLNDVQRWGIALWGCKNITVQNCYVYKAGASAIIAIVSDFGSNDIYPVPQLWNIKILRNTIEKANWSSGDNEGISVWATDGFEVAYNRLIDCEREGIDVKTGSRNGSIHHNYIKGQRNKWSGTGMGIYIDGWHYETYNIDVFNNLIEESEEGIEINCEDCARGDASAGVHDIRIFNNVVWGSRDLTGQSWKGRCMSLFNFPSGRVSDIHLYNNTFVGASVAGIWIENEHLKNMYIRNNIIVNNNGLDLNILKGDNIVVENNILSSSPQNKAGAVVHDNTLSDPGFIDAASNDYHLRESSPAIDMADGDDIAAFDYDSIPRPQGQKADIGAYEYSFPVVAGRDENVFGKNPKLFMTRVHTEQKMFRIYDIAGRRVRIYTAGTINDDAGALTNGIYIIEGTGVGSSAFVAHVTQR